MQHVLKMSNQKTLWTYAERKAGEAQDPIDVGSGLVVADSTDERSSHPPSLMDLILDRGNLHRAMERVIKKRGSGGVDGMRVSELRAYMSEHTDWLIEGIQGNHYHPSPVRSVRIPKGNGKERQLGIPTLVDRVIQQAMLEQLQPYWEPSFSETSYGFRPGRSCDQAVERASAYIKEGFTEIVNIDLESFFDKVKHDKLMSETAKRIKDKKVLKLLRRYLTSGIMERGVLVNRGEGVPQGGPLSPFLSNIMLDLLDKELEKRGHRFVRYADDAIILTRSERSAHRVMDSMVLFIEKKLKLKVNQEKSEVLPFRQCRFLGIWLGEA